MRDMTKGKPFDHLWHYALPLLLGNWMQLAYNAVDSIIAGRFIGRDALAAEGIAGPVMNLVILFVSGICIGSGVLMSEAFGAKDYPRLRKTLSTTITLGVGTGIVVALVGVLLSSFLMKLLSVPEEIFSITTVYLQITFLGTPFTFLYNAVAQGLKSAGDSKTPLKFLAFSSILNALLDVIFLGVLGFGIVCSATTTVVAEAVSAFLAVWYLDAKVHTLMPRKEDRRMERKTISTILKYGGPTALQQAIQPIGKIFIQGAVNLLGVSAIAAFNAAAHIDSFALIPEQGIGHAASTYIAQNRGAGRNDRVRHGFRAACLMEACYWLFIGTVVFFLREPIMGLFVKDDASVIQEGGAYLMLMAFFYVLPGYTNVFQSFYRGCGKMYTTMLGTTIQITVRTIFTYILAPVIGIKGVALASAAGWILMLLFEIPYYFLTCRKRGFPVREKV